MIKFGALWLLSIEAGCWGFFFPSSLFQDLILSLNSSMGQELELDINDKSPLGLSPNTVLPSPQYCSNAKRRSKKGQRTRKDDFITLKGDFADIKLARFRSSSCKSLLSRPHGWESNIDMRRGSVYQSSEEIKTIKRMSVGGRQKIEISRSSDISFSGSSIVDSLCDSDDEGSEQRYSEISQDSMEPNSSNGFIEFCINSDVRGKNSTAVYGRDSIKLKVRSDRHAGSLKKETVCSLQKSVFSKVEDSHLQLSPLRSDYSSRVSPKVELTTIRKRMSQFTKSQSLRSPISQKLEKNEMANITRNRSYQKSLLNDLSKTAKQSEIISEFIDREIQYSGIASSPVHLHGNLKIENKHGLPYFEFKVKCPEDVFVAKTWRTSNAFNWVYTFHSIDNRKKSNVTVLESNDFDKDSSMVAQMLVSCNLCSELESKEFDNSVVTELVLYDLTHLRQSVSQDKKSFCGQDASCVGSKEEPFRPDEDNLAIKNKLQDQPLSSHIEFDHSNCYPSFSTKSYSNLEAAAIVLQIPFSRRQSLKYSRDRIGAKECSSTSDLTTAADQRRETLHQSKIQEQLKVVIPTGNHGLPNAESEGPSSLLDRLRHGGGCDCGGWDMACPLILLGNPSIQFAEDYPLMQEYQPLELFVQGTKDTIPTFSMKIVAEGQYTVDFHAQLSALQAFSICVAILHGTSTTHSGAGHLQNPQLSQSSSLKMLIEEDVELYINSVTTEEKKTAPSKTRRGIPQTYALNPPFSPIARV